MKTAWQDYAVWFRYTPDRSCPSKWMWTKNSIKARTPKEAERKMRRRHSGMGLHSMQLVAVPGGKDPNLEGA